MTAVGVAVVGLGGIGARIAGALLARPSVRLMAAADADPAKAGADVGVLAGGAPIGVAVTGRIAGLPPATGPAVAVLCTSSDLAAVVPQAEQLLRLGYDVLSTCEELAEPWDRPALAGRLGAAALVAGRSVLGGGVNPGFLLDALPLFLSAACVRVDHVLARRTLDTDGRRAALQRKAGVGVDPGEFHRLAAEDGIGHVGLRRSAELLAAGLGWAVEEYRETIDPVLAERDTPTGLGLVAAGRVIGLRQVAIAGGGGRELVRYELDMHAGAGAVDEIVIAGHPPLRSVLVGGLHGDLGTVGVVCNLVPVVAAARPGLLTMRDVVPLAGRGA